MHSETPDPSDLGVVGSAARGWVRVELDARWAVPRGRCRYPGDGSLQRAAGGGLAGCDPACPDGAAGTTRAAREHNRRGKEPAESGARGLDGECRAAVRGDQRRAPQPRAARWTSVVSRGEIDLQPESLAAAGAKPGADRGADVRGAHGPGGCGDESDNPWGADETGDTCSPAYTTLVLGHTLEALGSYVEQVGYAARRPRAAGGRRRRHGRRRRGTRNRPGGVGGDDHASARADRAVVLDRADLARVRRGQAV